MRCLGSGRLILRLWHEQLHWVWMMILLSCLERALGSCKCTKTCLKQHWSRFGLDILIPSLGADDLQGTKNFYQTESQEFLGSNSIPDYLKKVWFVLLMLLIFADRSKNGWRKKQNGFRHIYTNRVWKSWTKRYWIFWIFSLMYWMSGQSFTHPRTLGSAQSRAQDAPRVRENWRWVQASRAFRW